MPVIETPPIEAPITSIQPGGGLCFALELAWGRLRRGVLRRLRPGYVRRMLALRQGECRGCAHDIIDPRDLKPYRNVCGHWFRPEDDRFAWRDRLGLARPGLAEVVLFSLLLLPSIAAGVVAGILLHPLAVLPAGLLASLWIFIIAFFRDPRRRIPEGDDLLLSPADGAVTHVDEVEMADFPGGRAFRIGIFLSVFNVHVNRLPRSGRVRSVRYYPGAFLDARHRECPVRNEQLWIDLEDSRLGCPVRVRQIAGAVARRIVCWLRPGEEVNAGERLGMIKFGSRTEVLVPVELVAEVLVKVGDVVAGCSRALLRLRPVSPRSA